MKASPIILWEAGSRKVQRHALSCNANSLDPDRATAVARFVEFWCQQNARGPWRVHQTQQDVTVSFFRDADMIHFRISDMNELF